MKTTSEVISETLEIQLWSAENLPDAFMRISEAKRCMEAFAAQTRWIPCSDRLPEMNQTVLVFVSNPFFKDNHVHNSYYDYVLSDGSVCWRGIEPNVHRYPDDRIEVTHWMPLPDSPNIKK